MIRLKVQGDGLRPMNLKWWKPTQSEWVPVLLDDHPQFWKKQVDPTYQRPWKKLTPRYADWKTKKYPGESILRATGAMQEASYILTRGNQFLVRSTPYGAYHQFGTNKMTARPWMGVPDVSLKNLVPIAWKNILSRKR
jgi:phage gpG-like protein